MPAIHQPANLAKSAAALLLVISLSVLTPSFGQDAGSAPATRQAVVGLLSKISGHQILSGQQDGPNSAPAKWESQVEKMTGRHPAIYGGDFGFEPSDVSNRAKLVAQVEAEWKAGSLPTLSWHACPPTTGDTCPWEHAPRAVQSKLSDQEWTELVTDGSPLNRRWKARLDEIVPFLQELKERGIPVLFRPQHEMNEGWSWWGGRPGPQGSRRLYQITHDYLLHVKKLDHLVWVWNVKDVAGGASRAADYWPGAGYVDVVTLDAWVQKQPSQDWYRAILALAGQKPIALAEVGTLPTAEMLNAQPRWAYFSEWRNWLTDTQWNSPESVRKAYSDQRVLSRGDFRLPGR